MNIKTIISDRPALVKAISEHLGVDSTYSGPPSFAYRIGTITVERDGSLICEQPADLEALKPFLLEQGYIEPEVEVMDITLPVEDATAEILINLTYMLYSKQYLIGKSVGSQQIHIPDSLITRLKEQPPQDLEAYIALLDEIKASGDLSGFDFRDGQLTLSFPLDTEHPNHLGVYAELGRRVIQAAREAKRVSAELQTPENEKYLMRGWLLRLGYGGTNEKAARDLLLKNLKGYAAFKNDADMERHKAKYAGIRKAQREERMATKIQEQVQAAETPAPAPGLAPEPSVEPSVAVENDTANDVQTMEVVSDADTEC